MTETKKRSLADIDANLERAKLCRPDMQPLSQTIYFHPQTSEDFILLEVDAHLLDEAKTSGLVIRGDPEDELVLCTSTRTYGVRETEISNSLLVVPNLRVPEKNKPVTTDNSSGLEALQVIKTFHSYWEPRPLNPSARKLHSLLSQTEFRGVELEGEINSTKLLTWNDLLERIQTSEAELKVMLKSLPIAEVAGYYRLLGFEYHFRVLEFILTSIESNSMVLDQIDCNVIIEEVSELEPRTIVGAVLELYVKDGILLKDKVSRTQAEALLRSGNSFSLDQFLVTWQQSLPEGLNTDLAYLHGIAYVDEDRPKPTIHYLSLWDLPEPESARFDALLRMKTCWAFEEIQPYICDLSAKSVNSLLLKYARAFRRNGQLRYSKK